MEAIYRRAGFPQDPDDLTSPWKRIRERTSAQQIKRDLYRFIDAAAETQLSWSEQTLGEAFERLWLSVLCTGGMAPTDSPLPDGQPSRGTDYVSRDRDQLRVVATVVDRFAGRERIYMLDEATKEGRHGRVDDLFPNEERFRNKTLARMRTSPQRLLGVVSGVQTEP
jgi:hypothetical protein